MNFKYLYHINILLLDINLVVVRCPQFFLRLCKLCKLDHPDTLIK